MPGAVYCGRLFITSLCVCVCVYLCVSIPVCLCVNSWVPLLCLFPSVNVSAQALAYACVCKRVPFHSCLGIHEQMGAGVYQ